MGSQTAYCCDGPKCEVLTIRAPGTTYPSAWLRASVRLPGEPVVSGAFHSPECAVAWVTERANAKPEPAVAVTPITGGTGKAS